MAVSKVREILVLADDVAAPVAAEVDVQKYSDMAIQVQYGAGGAGDLVLEASIDKVDWAPVTGSTQAIDPAGGFHMWNVTNAHYVWLRVVVPAAAVNVTVKLAGQKLDKDM